MLILYNYILIVKCTSENRKNEIEIVRSDGEAKKAMNTYFIKSTLLAKLETLISKQRQLVDVIY